MAAREEQAQRAELMSAQFADILGSVERIFFAATVQGVPFIVSCGFNRPFRGLS